MKKYHPVKNRWIEATANFGERRVVSHALIVEIEANPRPGAGGGRPNWP